VGWLACGLAAAVLTGGAFATGHTLEPLAITIAQECVWGDQVLAGVLQERLESADEALHRRLRRVGGRVARVSDRPDHLYRFLALEGEEPQAFSAPCGVIWASEGLLRTVDDDELAFAMGHEIAHTILRHHVRQLQIESLLEPAVGVPKSLLELTHATLQLEAEMEADRFGALYAMRAGYRFSAAPDVLGRLEAFVGGPRAREAREESERRQQGLREFRAELARTMTRFDDATAAIQDRRPEEAIANLRLFVAQFPNSVAGRVNLATAYLLKVQLQAGSPAGLAEELPMLPGPWPTLRDGLSRFDLERARENFQVALDIQPDPLAEIGLGVVDTRFGDFDGAREHLDRARAGAPGHVQVLLARGNVEYLDGKYTEARFYYLEALRLQPGWAPAIRNIAMAYDELGEHEKARAFRDGLPASERLRDDDLLAPPAVEEQEPGVTEQDG
jgi:tetratricopeptide (TPR) repeat protein